MGCDSGVDGKAKNCSAIFLTPCYRTPAASGLTHLGSSKEWLRGKLCLPTLTGVSFFSIYNPMNSKFTSTLASIGLIITAAIWGFAFVVVKDSLDYIGPMYMVAVRYTIAAVCMSFIFIKKWKIISKKYLLHGALTGFFLFAGYATQTVGCNITTAGKNAFLTTVYVILVPLFSWPLYKKRPGWFVFAAAILSMTGIGLLALGTGDTNGINPGDVLTLICGVFFALHIIFTAKYNAEDGDNGKGGDPIFLTLLQFIFVSIFGWIAAPVFDGAFSGAEAFNSHVIISMLYLGLLSTMLCFSLQNIGLKYVPSALASLFLSFESVFGVLFSTIFLHEKLTLRMVIGCILIFAAIVLAENGSRLHKYAKKCILIHKR